MAESLESRIGPALRAFLEPLLREGEFRVTYQISSPPPDPGDAESPEMLVEFMGPDSGLLVANDSELLRAIEHLSIEVLNLNPADHQRLWFDCQGKRRLRVQELRTLAAMAAERVAKNGLPYSFAPMSPRDRRTIHLALQAFPVVRSESEGEGRDRHIVVRSIHAPAPAPSRQRREYRRL